MMKIKICGITDAANATELAAMCPDYLGFIFYEGSKRFIGNDPGYLFSRIPPEIKKTGVFVNEILSNVIDLAFRYRLDLVQLHGSESPDECRVLNKAGIKVIKAFSIRSGADFSSMRQYLDVCELFLFDSATGSEGGSGRKFDWSLLGSYGLDKPFLLSGGIGPEDAGQLRDLKISYLEGVDINSKFEISPGIKDLNTIRTFINNIKMLNDEL
ncbi:MAG: phosphoribosylanthranilate isomerase [Bacteroidales bacterium]